MTTQVDVNKADLPELLIKVQQGETVALTRRGRPVAKLIPVKKRNKRISKVIEQMEEFQKNGPTLGPDLTLEQLIKEGRRR
jgi:prevent-host-death family protein